MHVAWIGMGQIGRPMALRVLAGGHTLGGYARRPEAFDDVRAAGGVVTPVLADAVAGGDLVCVNLFSEEQLAAVLSDQGGLAAIRPGAVLVIHSTVSPEVVRALAAQRPDIEVLDAAFSGTDADAAARHIALMVGGSETALERARPVFECYADFIAHVGPTGAGMALKLVNNLLFAAHAALARDGLAVLDAHEIARADAVRVLRRSSGGSYATQLFEGTATPEEVMARIGPYLRKDVAVARAALGTRATAQLLAATEQFVE